MAAVETVILNMEPIRRETLLLHWIERLSYADIGARLSLSRAAVRTNIAEAVHDLACGLASLEAERGTPAGI